VHHFKQSGELIKTIGTGTAGGRPGELMSPTGIAICRLSSSVFIGEHGNDRISEFNQSDGAFARVLDTPGLENPRGMCLSPDESTLAVACAFGSDRIKLISIDGSVASKTIGKWGSGEGQLKRPLDVHFTPDGQQLVVADYLNHRVHWLALDGSFVCQIPLGAASHAVAVDAAGNVVAATEKHHFVVGDLENSVNVLPVVQHHHALHGGAKDIVVPNGGQHCSTSAAGTDGRPELRGEFFRSTIGKHVKVFSPEGTLLHNRLGGFVMGEVVKGGLAIDPLSGRIAVGDAVGLINLL
jgi:DNA-binding beta-propeller fold protein YncE